MRLPCGLQSWTTAGSRSRRKNIYFVANRYWVAPLPGGDLMAFARGDLHLLQQLQFLQLWKRFVNTRDAGFPDDMKLRTGAGAPR